MTKYAQNGGLTRFDEGKSHQENPLGGIPIGGNNSVEENETKQNNQEAIFERVIQSKDEQIEILKKSIKWMKNQHFMEIKRLEKNQKRVIEVFNSEIKLLQSAFNEMRAIYKPQIENQKNEKKNEFITLQDFFIILKRASKSDLEIKNSILNCVKNGDKRFIYNKNSKKLLILNDSFEDLI